MGARVRLAGCAVPYRHRECAVSVARGTRQWRLGQFKADEARTANDRAVSAHPGGIHRLVSYNRLPRRRRTGSRRRVDRLLRTIASLDRVVRSALARASRLGVSAHQPECAGVERYHRQSGRRCSHRSDGRHVRSLSSHLRRSQLAPKTGDAVSNWLEKSARSQEWLGNCSKTNNACFPHLRDRRRPRICLSAPETERNAAGHRSEEHTSELQSLTNLVCRLLLEKKKKRLIYIAG